MLTLTVIPTFVAFGALYYAWKQSQLAKQLAKNQEQQQREVLSWQVRHEKVARMISKQPGHAFFNVPNRGSVCLYTAVFKDPQLRRDIESYLVEHSGQGSLFKPRMPNELELRSPALRGTVEQVERALEDSKQTDPELYKHYA